MIHSLAGGELRTDKVCDIAKVEILENNTICYYICEIKDVKIGDVVLVPYGPVDELTMAKVLRIDKNMNSKNFPFKFERMKKICKRAN